MDELLQRAADKMGMPPILAERSAQARAEKEGTTVEAVLREWAGEDADSSGSADADDAGTEKTDPSPPEAAEEAATDPGSDEAASSSGPTEVTTDYLVALAAESKRMPPKLVRSSAEARARNSNTDLDVVLAGWAGVDLDELREQAAAGTAPVAHPPADEAAAKEPSPAPSEPEEQEPETQQAAAPEPEAPAAPAAAPAAAAVAALSLIHI